MLRTLSVSIKLILLFDTFFFLRDIPGKFDPAYEDLIPAGANLDIISFMN